MLELHFTGPLSCSVKVEHNSCFVDVMSIYQMSLLFNRNKFPVVANAHRSLRLSKRENLYSRMALKRPRITSYVAEIWKLEIRALKIMINSEIIGTD
jgi:hypothetical protein